MEKRYVAKDDTWFDVGSEAVLIEYMYDAGSEAFGNFEGTYTVGDSGYDCYWHKKGHKTGDKVVMREVCSYNEFHITNKLPDTVVMNKLMFDFMEDLFENPPEDFMDNDNADNMKQAWLLGFKAGFKYLDDGLEKK